jgi:hypothetical protein
MTDEEPPNIEERLVQLVQRSYQTAFKNLVAKHIATEMAKLGVVLTESQQSDAAARVLGGKGDRLIIDLDDTQIEQLRAQHSGLLPDVTIDFTSLTKSLDNLEGKYLGAISDTVTFATEDLALELLESWKTSTPEILVQLREESQDFGTYVKSRWGDALDSLDALIDLLTDIGGQLYADRLNVGGESADPVITVLFSLHMRACQVAREVAVLLKAGLADGALARWRTLHELAVTAAFIRKHGAEIALRFQDHVDMQTYRAAEQYQRHCKQLGQEPLPAEEMTKLEARKNELVTLFGRDFKSDYGWAIPALPMRSQSTKPRRPTFAVIEADVGLEFVRPFFQDASDNIHAGSRGTAYRLSAALSGASDVGLELPGRNTAWSLIQISVDLINAQVTMERLAISTAIQKLGKSIYEAFDMASY